MTTMSWFFSIRDKKSNKSFTICYIQIISQLVQARGLLWHNLQILENLPSNIFILASPWKYKSMIYVFSL